MKLNKIFKAAATLLVAATALAGCKFEGTTASFKEDVRNGYTTEWDSVEKPGIIIDCVTYLTKAESNSRLDVKIVSQGKLDEKSIEAAFDYYSLSDNTADTNYAPIRGPVFSKKIIKIDTETSSYGIDLGGTGYWFDNHDDTANERNRKCFVTTIEIEVDLSSVTKDYIAAVVDATKLKEKAGNLVLNGNDNEKCGEESDSIYWSINIDLKNDDTATEALVNDPDSEKFAPIINLGSPARSFVLDAESKQTGELEYTVSADWERKATDGSYIYTDGFASDLGNMYSIRTLAIGETKWTETPLSFTYDSDNHEYVAKTAALAYGTKYCLVTKSKNELEWAAAKDWYGHTPRLGYDKNRTSYGNVYTYTYLKDSPLYIVNTPDNSEAATELTFTSTTYSQGSFDHAQCRVNPNDSTDNWGGLLSVSKRTNAVQVTINTTNDIRFDSYDGFVITDNKMNILKTKAPVVYQKDAKGVYSVIIELENKNLSLNGIKVWVGEKTTINGNKAYPSQTKFGAPAVEDNSLLAGYVQIM